MTEEEKKHEISLLLDKYGQIFSWGPTVEIIYDGEGNCEINYNHNIISLKEYKCIELLHQNEILNKILGTDLPTEEFVFKLPNLRKE